MNPTEQKQHKKRTDELEALIGTVESAAVEAIAHLRAAIGAERTARLDLARESLGQRNNPNRCAVDSSVV